MRDNRSITDYLDKSTVFFSHSIKSIIRELQVMAT